jgi:hypothetical protein
MICDTVMCGETSLSLYSTIYLFVQQPARIMIERVDYVLRNGIVSLVLFAALPLVLERSQSHLVNVLDGIETFLSGSISGFLSQKQNFELNRLVP